MKFSHLLHFAKGESLLSRCFRGSAVLGVGSVVDRAARFVRNMILARWLLGPEHFGLMALVLASSQLFEAFTEVGVRQAVVQHKSGDDDNYLNIAWWFNAIRGVGLYLVGFLISPLLAVFYHEPALESLLKVAFLVMFFRGLTSPGLFVLEKKLKFIKVVVVNQGSGILGTLVSFVLALFYPNVWSLVIGFVTEAIFRSLGSFLVYRFCPRFRFDRAAASQLFKFSRGMIGLPILTYLFMQADIFVLGRMCSKEVLGFYSLSLALAMIPQMLFSRIISPLALPAFSEMQDEKERMRKNLKRMTTVLFLFGLPMVACFSVFARPILEVVYGPDYGQTSAAYAILSFYVLFYMAGTFIASIYFAIGKPGIQRLFAIFRLILIAVLIYPFVLKWGTAGAATARLLSLLIAGIVQLFSLRKCLDFPIQAYLQTVVKGMLLAVCICIPAILWRVIVDSVWLQVAGAAALCGISWLVAAVIFKNRIVGQMKATGDLEAAP